MNGGAWVTLVIEIQFWKSYLFCSGARVPKTGISNNGYIALQNLLACLSRARSPAPNRQRRTVPRLLKPCYINSVRGYKSEMKLIVSLVK